jgi:hypothetical protein
MHNNTHTRHAVPPERLFTLRQYVTTTLAAIVALPVIWGLYCGIVLIFQGGL